MDGYSLKLKTILEQSTVTGQLRLTNFQLSKLPPLPDSLDLTDVTDFDISDNSISELDESFCLRLLNLQRFYGLKNFVSSIPPAFARFQLLKVLDLSNNRLTKVPSEIGELVSLEILLLSHNEIYLLPESIGRLCSLLELDISHNCLTELPRSLSALVSLQVLNINSNALTDLVPLFNRDTVPTSRPPNCFCSSCRVSQSDTGEPAHRCRFLTPRELHVAGNRIERLPAELLQWRSSLRVLDLSANPLIFPSPHLVARGLPHIFRALASSQRLLAPRANTLPPQQPQRTSTISKVLAPITSPSLLTSQSSPPRQKTSVPRTQAPAQCLFFPQTNAIVSNSPVATAASFAPQISCASSCCASKFLGPQRSETMPVLPETAASEVGTRPPLRPKPAVKPKPVKSVLGNCIGNGVGFGVGVPGGQLYENLYTCKSTSATSAYAGAGARKESAPAGPVFACSLLNNGSDSGFESNRSSLYAAVNQNGEVIPRAAPVTVTVTSPLRKQATVSQSSLVQSAASASPQQRQAQTARADAALYENLYVGVNGSPAAVQVLTPDSYAYRQKSSSPATAATAALASSVYVPVSPCGGNVQPSRGLPCHSQMQSQMQSQSQMQALAAAAVAPAYAYASPKQPQLPPGAASTAIGGGGGGGAQSRPPSAADALLTPRSRTPLNGTQLRSTSLPPATHLPLDVSLSSIT